MRRAEFGERAAEAVPGNPNRLVAPIEQTPRQDLSVGERDAPYFAKGAVEPVVHVTNVVVPGAASGAEIDEPVHWTIRLGTAEGHDDGVGAFGNKALGVGVVEDVE